MSRKRNTGPPAEGGTGGVDAAALPAPGVWPLGPRGAATAQRWAEQRKHRYVSVRVERNADRRALLLAIGQAFAFPAWYGANLDALYDCLTDLPDQGSAAGCVAVIEGLSAHNRQQPVLDTLADAARDLAQRNFELRVFVTAPPHAA